MQDPLPVPTLADYTRPGLILSDSRATQPAAVVAELAQLLVKEGCIPDAEAFTEAVMQREDACSTVFAPCWALPHARIRTVTKTTLALARLSKSISWGADSLPVRLVFLFAVPDSDAVTYMNVISALARLNGDERATETLLKTADPLSFLSQVPLRRARSNRP